MDRKKLVLSIIFTLLVVLVLYNVNNTKTSYAAGDTLAEVVKNLATTANCNAGASGVCKTNDTDYRYVGANVNNYVKFNNDMYRIIGVFSDNTHGVTGKELVKLIRSRKLGGSSWGVNNGTDNATYSAYNNLWVDSSTPNVPKANLNILLNEYFLNKTDTSTTFGDCSNWNYYYRSDTCKTKDCSDIVSYGIDSSSRTYIEDAKWYLNGPTTQLTKVNTYTCERGTNTTSCAVATNGSSSTTAKIGLMYASDYLYASSYYSSTDTSKTSSSNYFGNKNWLYKGYEWTITPYGSDSSIAWIVDYGVLYSSYTDYPIGWRPSFYLKSDVYITGSGDGSFNNPYTLGCDTCGS